MDKLQLDVARARRAKELIEDELLIDTLKHLEWAYAEAWKSAQTPEQREALWNKVRALADFHEHLHTVLSDGRLAQVQIQKMVAPRQAA